ncbi:hypothetical protein FBQ97_11100 [Acidobacteria bacterium ACD]|nr:MAG: hypothetical protein EDX89_09005 [Acidobacteriota bacterium]MCE7960457.1 hypothetical protein [Acidobacteria bacterium ACB2]MDL1950347.1 hypothetical protein [Acidobacteria bacterium ACD]
MSSSRRAYVDPDAPLPTHHRLCATPGCLGLAPDEEDLRDAATVFCPRCAEEYRRFRPETAFGPTVPAERKG